MKDSAWYMDSLSSLIYWKSENCAGVEFSPAIFAVVEVSKISDDGSCYSRGQLYRLGKQIQK